MGLVQCWSTSPIDNECSKTSEQFMNAALTLEPKGQLWGQRTPIKLGIYKAFGELLSHVNSIVCDWLVQQRGCNADDLTLELFELEYDTLNDCTAPISLEERKARVCAAIQGQRPLTLQQLENLLQTALNCSWLKLRMGTQEVLNWLGSQTVGEAFWVDDPSSPRAIYMSGILGTIPSYENWLGEFQTGETFWIDNPVTGTCAIVDPLANPKPFTLYGNAVGGDGDKIRLLDCLLKKYVPAHVGLLLE